ncbi:MAG: hypothetical protein SCARUB_03121 [Candidatus Scalindua rubra]|uniref:Uncharacterized protein n=1 Tax=Candidatus Scalindua rubra TaxID=1872076 RepID=A0A1E3X807_9BACT|nr:MAG: hypothetical protein SCARUB_03121 [Candidatus Scalindua rubra]
MENLWLIISKPDNIPISGLIVMLIFFTWLPFRQALKNDRLRKEGRR